MTKPDSQPKFTIKEIPIQLCDNNFGQIEGVPENPRTITADDFQNLKKSLEDDPGFLWIREPLVYPLNGRYVAIAGNQRLRALRELPVEFMPAKVLDENTPLENLIKWAIKDNTNKGEWDWDLLANGEWPEDKLTDWGIDMPEDRGEAHNTNPEEDEIPEPPKTPVSKLGDLWLLDNHRVLCGDSTDQATVERLMDGKKADMVFTDPPYGVDYKGINNDGRDGLEELLDSAFNLMSEASKDGSSCYVFHSDKCADIFHKVFRKYCKFSSMIIWVKPSLVMSRSDYHSRHEPCLYGWFNTGTHNWYSDRKQDSIWEMGREQKLDHTTPKPVEFCIKAISNSTKNKALVLDVFLGSGSTLIACEQTNRTCYGLELDPQYIDVICKRWQTLTGTMPILESTGEAHDFLEG